jgi:LuxR family transcriptional regulator/LuxR family quorum-sensing system transcriptional regulator CciR
MEQVLARVDRQISVERVIAVARAEGSSLGVKAATFHLTAPHASQVGPRVVIAAFGHSRDWIGTYRDPKVRQHDPVPDHVMRSGRVMTYGQALDELSLKPAQAAFAQQLRAAGLADTMALPVYGPFDFDTFATFSIGRPFTAEDAGTINRIVAMVEIANRRIAQLVESRSALDISLSERELEVLHWIGLSKSNGDIATILNISPGSIDTYVRRLFAKLEVNDRIAAAVKGFRLGLIRY